jgi:hypothetical protein
MEEELEISRETIRKILMEDLGKRKNCASFVPRCLTDEQKAQTSSLSRVYSICGWWPFLAWLNCDGWWDLVFPVWSPNKKTKHGMALAKLSKITNFDFRNKKTKGCWAYSLTAKESFFPPGQTGDKFKQSPQHPVLKHLLCTLVRATKYHTHTKLQGKWLFRVIYEYVWWLLLIEVLGLNI